MTEEEEDDDTLDKDNKYMHCIGRMFEISFPKELNDTGIWYMILSF